jgi:hypothetical protein
VWWVHETTSGPQHEYRRWRISTEKLERAQLPASRQATLSIAPQSVSSVYWSQCSSATCLIGGDGSANFVASL